MAIKSLDLAGLMVYDGKIKQYIATLAGTTASSAISTHNSDINAHSTLLAGYVKTSRQVAGKALTSDITSAELTAALNEATTSLKGLMSAMDKTRLDDLWAVFDNGDDESFVDTLTEILEIFQNYPEGADIMAKLNQKVDKVEGKGLSTNDYDDTEKAKVAANTDARHTHSNKSILDSTSASFTTALKTKLDGIEAGAEKNKVNSVNNKTGNVTLTLDDVGDGTTRKLADFEIISEAEIDALFS